MHHESRAERLIRESQEGAEAYCKKVGLVGAPAFLHLIGRLEGLVKILGNEADSAQRELANEQQRLTECDAFIHDRDLWEDFRVFCGVVDQYEEEAQ